MPCAQRNSKRADALALLVIPSGITTFGLRPEMVVEHFWCTANASDLALIDFQYCARPQRPALGPWLGDC